jgi:hypothetical protein
MLTTSTFSNTFKMKITFSIQDVLQRYRTVKKINFKTAPVSVKNRILTERLLRQGKSFCYDMGCYVSPCEKLYKPPRGKYKVQRGMGRSFHLMDFVGYSKGWEGHGWTLLPTRATLLAPGVAGKGELILFPDYFAKAKALGNQKYILPFVFPDEYFSPQGLGNHQVLFLANMVDNTITLVDPNPVQTRHPKMFLDVGAFLGKSLPKLLGAKKALKVQREPKAPFQGSTSECTLISASNALSLLEGDTLKKESATPRWLEKSWKKLVAQTAKVQDLTFIDLYS